jgi:ABC-type phosphate/phosphonate transport system permease subunit
MDFVPIIRIISTGSFMVNMISCSYISIFFKEYVMPDENELIKGLSKKIDEMSLKMEKMKFVDYVYFLEHPRKMLWANFISGIARGFGIAIGFTLLGAIVIYFLNKMVAYNLPVIGKFISEIVKIVQSSMRTVP